MQSGAGGFILPNDRVDVLLTHSLPGRGKQFATSTILTDVRVLAVDQTFGQKKDEKAVVGKTATLELTPGQAEMIARASAAGTLSLSLRPLADNHASNTVASVDGAGGVAIIRYGVSRGAAGQAGE